MELAIVRSIEEVDMHRKLAIVTALAVGCFSDKGWVPHCEETVSPVSMETVTELGFSGDDVMALAEISAVTFTFSDDTVSDGTVEITPLGGAEVIQRVLAEPPDGTTNIPLIDVTCDDTVEVPVEIRVTTEDGRLLEVGTSRLESVDGTSAWFSLLMQPDALQGTLDLSGIDRSRYDREELHFVGDLMGTSHTGRLTLDGSGETGDLGFAEANPVAEWASES